MSGDLKDHFRSLSERELMALLRRRRPEKFGDRGPPDGTGADGRQGADRPGSADDTNIAS